MISADKILTEDQLNKLLKKLRLEKDKSIAVFKASNKKMPRETRIILDYYLFSLIAYTGLRISEALSLIHDDIHTDFLIIRPENSKNGKKGTVYFGKKTKRLLDEYTNLKKELFKCPFVTFLFSLKPKQSSRSYIHTRFKYWLALSKLPLHLSVHSLRHTYGTLCLDKGLSLTFVRDNLRHSNISITSQYLHLTKENRDKVKDLF